MKISATSALVLNWTDPALWQTTEASAYFNRLDLVEGDSLLALFSKEESFMHLQAVSGRKYFAKQKVSRFLQNLQEQGRSGQVVILAAGLAPLSIEIASLFPSCSVFDVDKFLMEEKQAMVNGNPSNIKFIECDITEIAGLGQKLNDNGFDPGIPTIAVMEGIIYYLRKIDLKNILKFFCIHGTALACDFCLRPELVNEKTRIFLTEVFRKIKEEVHLDFIQFYSQDEMKQLIEEAGFKKISFTNMNQVQKERTGDMHPFITDDSCWVRNIYCE